MITGRDHTTVLGSGDYWYVDEPRIQPGSAQDIFGDTGPARTVVEIARAHQKNSPTPSLSATATIAGHSDGEFASTPQDGVGSCSTTHPTQILHSCSPN